MILKSTKIWLGIMAIFIAIPIVLPFIDFSQSNSNIIYAKPLATSNDKFYTYFSYQITISKFPALSYNDRISITMNEPNNDGNLLEYIFSLDQFGAFMSSFYNLSSQWYGGPCLYLNYAGSYNFKLDNWQIPYNENSIVFVLLGSQNWQTNPSIQITYTLTSSNDSWNIIRNIVFYPSILLAICSLVIIFAIQYSYLDDFVKNLSSVKKLIILDENIEKFPYFKRLINQIDACAHHKENFVLTPLLLRILFENLLYEIMLKGFGNEKSKLIFDPNENRRRDFGALISIFKIIKDNELKVFETIDDLIIDFLKNKIKKYGNFTAHELIPKISTKFVDEIQSELNMNLNILIHLIIKMEHFDLSEDSENKILKIFERKNAKAIADSTVEDDIKKEDG